MCSFLRLARKLRDVEILCLTLKAGMKLEDSSTVQTLCEFVGSLCLKL